MKTFLILFSVIFTSVQAHASADFTGDYYAIIRSYLITAPAGKLEGAVNITVAGDGSVSGHGTYVDHVPIVVTGMVKDSGKVVLYEGSEKFVGFFRPGGKQFVFAFPELSITAGKLARKFPEAGVYHAKTSSKEKVSLFVDRDKAVHGIVYGADHVSTEIEGTANNGGFSAESESGAIYTGEFDGSAFSGTFTTPSGGAGSFLGAKY